MTESLADGLPVSPAVSFILKCVSWGGRHITSPDGAQLGSKEASSRGRQTNKQPDKRRQVAATQKGNWSSNGEAFSAPVG